jgi:polyisoprenoid-binding protein YceI
VFSRVHRILRATAFFLGAVGISATAFAQQKTFQLDPGQSRVDFTLGDIFHTVHGLFRLKSGTIQFDPATGAASGALIVDALSGDSGNKTRDHKMDRDILETQKFFEIVFTPQHVTGRMLPNQVSQMEMQGIMTLHGQPHPMTLTVPLTLNGDQASADVHFVVPYVKWGLKNPSTLFLRVSDKVDITVHAVGHIAQQSAAATPPR